LEVEVTNISHHGFWLLIRDKEKFLPFELFPWFREASVAQIVAVEMPGEGHIYWPQLDIDLCEESIDHPELFPLISKTDPAIEKTVIG
jgi:hypothetical protein